MLNPTTRNYEVQDEAVQTLRLAARASRASRTSTRTKHGTELAMIVFSLLPDYGTEAVNKKTLLVECKKKFKDRHPDCGFVLSLLLYLLLPYLIEWIIKWIYKRRNEQIISMIKKQSRIFLTQHPGDLPTTKTA
jgi:hypothetical protein